jgi:hypothetical protein
MQSEIEPLSSTVAALGSGRGLFFRIGAPLALVLAFSAALLGWGYTSESAPGQTERPAPSVGLTGAHLGMTRTPLPISTVVNNPAQPKQIVDTRLDNEPRVLNDESKRISSLSPSQSTDLEIVRTGTGPAIVAIQGARQAGSTHYFVMEKRNGKFRVTARGPLDTENFRHALWSAEKVDANEDGYPEVLFIGSNSSARRYHRRLVLYIPNDRRSYSMLVTGQVTARGTPRIIWSANTARTDAAPYRTMLRQKAKRLLVVAKNR